MINDLKEAKYIKLRTNESFERFQINFKDNIVPKELRERANATELAKEEYIDFMSIPDEKLLSHLKVFDNLDFPHAVITVNVIDDKGAPSRATDVLLDDKEYKTVVDKLNHLEKEKSIER